MGPGLAAVAVTVALGLGGCSYLQTRDVGDEYVQGARVAIVEVLAGAGQQTRTGPDCVVDDGATALDCTGTTTTGSSVEAHASGGSSNDLDAAELTVTVDGSRIYEGSIAAVLARENE